GLTGGGNLVGRMFHEFRKSVHIANHCRKIFVVDPRSGFLCVLCAESPPWWVLCLPRRAVGGKMGFAFAVGFAVALPVACCLLPVTQVNRRRRTAFTFRPRPQFALFLVVLFSL